MLVEWFLVFVMFPGTPEQELHIVDHYPAKDRCRYVMLEYQATYPELHNDKIRIGCTSTTTQTNII